MQPPGEFGADLRVVEVHAELLAGAVGGRDAVLFDLE